MEMGFYEVLAVYAAIAATGALILARFHEHL
jgi:hypothetical protein